MCIYIYICVYLSTYLLIYSFLVYRVNVFCWCLLHVRCIPPSQFDKTVLSKCKFVCVCLCLCVCAPPWSLCHFDTHTKLSKASTSRLGPRNTRLRSIGKATPRRKECVGMRWSVGTLSSEIVHFCVCVCIYIL